MIEDRNKDERKQERPGKAEHDGKGERTPEARGEGQGDHADDRHDRSEYDRTETGSSSLDDDIGESLPGTDCLLADARDRVHENDGVIDDDAGERDDAEHRREGERRVHEEEAKEDADQGQRNNEKKVQGVAEGIEL